MPTFDTPAPIHATLELLVADVRITATDRADTVVEVRPTDPSSAADLRAAEQTQVQFADGQLLVRTPKTLKTMGILRRSGSIEVEIALPTGSRLHADAALAAFHCGGTLGGTSIRTATGDVELQHTGPLEVNTSAGSVFARSVTGAARATTGSGTIRLGTVSGAAVLKNSNGDTQVDSVGGDLTAKTANGGVAAGRVGGSVDAATANGSVRIGAVRRGTVEVRSSMGELEVGIAAGTAAYLDLHTQFGKVLNHLDGTGGPEPGEDEVQLRARTSFGDIIVRRADGEELR